MKALLLALAMSAALPAAAATFRVDDSGTIPGENQTAMKWRSVAPGRGADNNVVEGTTLVNVRLNLAPWVNRQGRIFLALPEQPAGQVNAEWSTQGKLIPGRLVSGNRTLVYSGPVRGTSLEDAMLLRIWTDGRRLVASQRLDFHFEIDVD
jgi:hypothetical protein